MSDQKVHWHHDGPALNRSLLVDQEEQDLVDASECTYPTVIKGKENRSPQWLDLQVSFGIDCTPDALPVTTLPIYPVLGPALGIHWLVTH